MPASKKTSKPSAKNTAKAKPAAKAETAKGAVKAKAKAAAAEPAKPKSVQPESVKPEPATPEPAQAAAPKTPVKGKPQIPGKPEPSWAKFNQGGNHAQKMMKGRPFRHQGR